MDTIENPIFPHIQFHVVKRESDGKMGIAMTLREDGKKDIVAIFSLGVAVEVAKSMMAAVAEEMSEEDFEGHGVVAVKIDEFRGPLQ